MSLPAAPKCCESMLESLGGGMAKELKNKKIKRERKADGCNGCDAFHIRSNAVDGRAHR